MTVHQIEGTLDMALVYIAELPNGQVAPYRSKLAGMSGNDYVVTTAAAGTAGIAKGVWGSCWYMGNATESVVFKCTALTPCQPLAM